VLALLIGPEWTEARLERWTDFDGGAYVVPIIEAVDRMSRRARSRGILPHYLIAARDAYHRHAPFACFALHDAFRRYVTETRRGVPEYAMDALLTAEHNADLCDRDDLEYLGPQVPRVATHDSCK
jgi:hypothetical protein